MGEAGGPLGEVLAAGEREVSGFRDGGLTLTTRRVLRRSSGAIAAWDSIHLVDLTAVGIGHRFHFNRRLLLLPLAVFLLGYLLAGIMKDIVLLLFGTTFALFALPLPWMASGRFIILTVPGRTVKVKVPLRHRQEAHDFVRRVEAERLAARATDDRQLAVEATTRPFVR